MKKIFFGFLLGVLSVIIIITSYNFFTSFERNLDNMLSTMINYKKTSITSGGLSADACCYLASAKRKVYFGQLPNDAEPIIVRSPSRASMYIYPNDEKSVIVKYAPHNGITRNYVLTYIGFNRYLEIFYEMTDNEVFNETIDINVRK